MPNIRLPIQNSTALEWKSGDVKITLTKLYTGVHHCILAGQTNIHPCTQEKECKCTEGPFFLTGWVGYYS